MIPNLEVLGTLMRDIHHTFAHLFYVALPVAILLSVILAYFKSGAPEYVDILRRALVAALLLASFPEVSSTILDVCGAVADKIDNMSGFEAIMRAAEEKSRSYSMAKSTLLLKFDDLIIAFFSYASFLLLCIARYLCVALYYFYWILLSVLSPILILLYMFPATAVVTKNLYRSLIEVACWKIVWAVQSAMLTSLSLGNIYRTEGSYLTLIVLNLIIAAGMLFTPVIVKSFMGEGAHSTAQTLGTVAVGALAVAPARFTAIGSKIWSVKDHSQSFITKRFQNFKNTNHGR